MHIFSLKYLIYYFRGMLMYKVIIIDDNKNDLNMMKNKIINCNKLE